MSQIFPVYCRNLDEKLNRRDAVILRFALFFKTGG
jgi:hypothetical protein